MAGDVWESTGLWDCSSRDRPGFTRLLFRHSQDTDSKPAVPRGPWALPPHLCPAASPPQTSLIFPTEMCFLIVSAPTLNTSGFPSLRDQPQFFLHVLYSHLVFLVGSACWAEREEWILRYQSSEKGCGANWWRCGMYHGGKEGPCSCLGKSISHTSLLHVSDKGKKNVTGDCNKTDWAF